MSKNNIQYEWGLSIYREWIGKKIKKHSGKKFKCGKDEVTVESITTNPHSNKIAFKIKEYQTIVDCIQCTPVDPIVISQQRKYDQPEVDLSTVSSNINTVCADQILSIVRNDYSWWKKLLFWLGLMKEPLIEPIHIIKNGRGNSND